MKISPIAVSAAATVARTDPRNPPPSPAAPAPAAAAPAPAAPPPADPAQAARAASPEGISAKGTIAATLASYGLPASLVDTLWGDWYVNKGTPFAQILMDLEGTPEFKTRFPGLTALKERRNRGEAVMIPSVGEYVQLEVGIASVMRDAELPPGLFDTPDDFAKFIGGSTSPKEVEGRIALARTAAFQMPAAAREELGRVYDIEPGELVAHFLDPTRTLPALQKKLQAAQMGGTAKRSGFGLLTRTEMEQLAGSGVTDAAAGQRFDELAQIGEGLFAETAGEASQGDNLGRATQIGYAAGSGTDAAAIDRRRKSRQANFQGGGGAAGGGEGRTGLG